MKRHEINEKQWNRIKDKFPHERKPQGGRPGKSNLAMLNAIPCWLNIWGFHAGFAGAIRPIAKRIQPVSGLDKSRSMGKYLYSPDRAGFGGRNNADAGQHYNQGSPTR